MSEAAWRKARAATVGRQLLPAAVLRRRGRRRARAGRRRRCSASDDGRCARLPRTGSGRGAGCVTGGRASAAAGRARASTPSDGWGCFGGEDLGVGCDASRGKALRRRWARGRSGEGRRREDGRDRAPVERRRGRLDEGVRAQPERDGRVVGRHAVVPEVEGVEARALGQLRGGRRAASWERRGVSKGCLAGRARATWGRGNAPAVEAGAGADRATEVASIVGAGGGMGVEVGRREG